MYHIPSRLRTLGEPDTSSALTVSPAPLVLKSQDADLPPATPILMDQEAGCTTPDCVVPRPIMMVSTTAPDAPDTALVATSTASQLTTSVTPLPAVPSTTKLWLWGLLGVGLWLATASVDRPGLNGLPADDTPVEPVALGRPPRRKPEKSRHVAHLSIQ